MINTTMVERFELAFWETAVMVLTRSPRALSVARFFYQIFREEERKTALMMGVSTSAAGFCFGVVLFSISMLLP